LKYIIFEEELLIELFKYISFTALSFIIVSLFNQNKVNQSFVIWDPVLSLQLFKILSITILIITTIGFILNAGFNLVANREQMMLEEQSIALGGKSLSPVQMLSNIFASLNKPLLIFSGYIICKEYANNNLKISALKLYYFYPFLSGTISTLAIGGRSGITTTLMFLFVGFALAICSLKTDTTGILKKIMKYGLIFFILFSVYSTSVNIIREGGASQSLTEARWGPYPWLKPFAGILQYLTDHYVGYQLRRIDTVTPQLELGQISLSGITMFKVPILSQLTSTPLSIQNAFNLYEPIIIGAASEDKLWTNVTGTVYLVLFDDFGYTGTYIAIFLFVLITQSAFNNAFRRQRRSFITLLPFVLIYLIWFTTIFSHVIIGNWMSLYIYSFLIIDVIGRIKP
jgi:hypothetical protein